MGSMANTPPFHRPRTLPFNSMNCQDKEQARQPQQQKRALRLVDGLHPTHRKGRDGWGTRADSVGEGTQAGAGENYFESPGMMA
jgi:hypothetical protein